MASAGIRVVAITESPRLPRGKTPLVEFLSKARARRSTERHLHDEDEVCAPGVMVTPAARFIVSLSELPIRPAIGCDEVSELMEAGVLAAARASSILGSDHDQPFVAIRRTPAITSDDGDGWSRMPDERGVEPRGGTKRVDVGRAPLDRHDRVFAAEQDSPELARRQGGCPLRVVRRILEPGRRSSPSRCQRERLSVISPRSDHRAVACHELERPTDAGRRASTHNVAGT